MSIENTEAFWEDLRKSSDTFKESLEIRPDDEQPLSKPRLYVVPSRNEK